MVVGAATQCLSMPLVGAATRCGRCQVFIQLTVDSIGDGNAPSWFDWFDCFRRSTYGSTGDAGSPSVSGSTDTENAFWPLLVVLFLCLEFCMFCCLCCQ